MRKLPIDLSKHEVVRGEVVVIKEKCKGCHLCVEFCPRKMLEISDDFNAKGYHYPKVVSGREDECAACGFCEIVCPDFAIYHKDTTRKLTEKDIR